jgi:hypothetical protein
LASKASPPQRRLENLACGKIAWKDASRQTKTSLEHRNSRTSSPFLEQKKVNENEGSLGKMLHWVWLLPWISVHVRCFDWILSEGLREDANARKIAPAFRRIRNGVGSGRLEVGSAVWLSFLPYSTSLTAKDGSIPLLAAIFSVLESMAFDAMTGENGDTGPWQGVANAFARQEAPTIVLELVFPSNHHENDGMENPKEDGHVDASPSTTTVGNNAREEEKEDEARLEPRANAWNRSKDGEEQH